MYEQREREREREREVWQQVPKEITALLRPVDSTGKGIVQMTE